MNEDRAAVMAAWFFSALGDIGRVVSLREHLDQLAGIVVTASTLYYTYREDAIMTPAVIEAWAQLGQALEAN